MVSTTAEAKPVGNAKFSDFMAALWMKMCRFRLHGEAAPLKQKGIFKLLPSIVFSYYLLCHPCSFSLGIKTMVFLFLGNNNSNNRKLLLCKKLWKIHTEIFRSENSCNEWQLLLAMEMFGLRYKEKRHEKACQSCWNFIWRTECMIFSGTGRIEGRSSIPQSPDPPL